MLYTQETCLYGILNHELRNHTDVDGAKAFLPYLKLLLTGLNKLPLVRAKVYRGIKSDVHEVYNQLKNKVFTWWAFSSTTPQKYQAEIYLHGSERTLFAIDAMGVDISAFSSFPDEQEVLLLPGTRLTVESGVVDEGHWTYELSVWRAAQQLRHHDDHHEDDDEDELLDDFDDCKSFGTESSEQKSVDVMDTSKNYSSVSIFQNIDMKTRARVRPSGGQTSLDPYLRPLPPRAWWSSKGTPSPHSPESPFSLLYPNRVWPAASALCPGLLSSAGQPMTLGDGSSKEET